MPEHTRIAVVISGGVSLGTYEAGALAAHTILYGWNDADRLRRAWVEEILITFFGDSAAFRVLQGPFDASLWDPIRAAAVASGAFPVAFPPRRLTRTEDSLLNPPPVGDPPIQFPHDFTYSDGGLLDNEPLGLARDIVAHKGDAGRRWYVLIDPYYSDADVEDPTFTPDKATFISMIRRLVALVSKSASSEDWLEVQKINNDLEWYRRARSLLMAILQGAPLPAGFSAEVDGAAAEVAVQKWGPEGPQRRTKYSDTLDVALARDFEWYGGFFRQEWRQDDFTSDRVDARKVLEETLFKGRPYPRNAGAPSPPKASRVSL